MGCLKRERKRHPKKRTCWSRPGSNRGPSACKADVMTTTLRNLTCLKDGYQSFDLIMNYYYYVYYIADTPVLSLGQPFACITFIFQRKIIFNPKISIFLIIFILILCFSFAQFVVIKYFLRSLTIGINIGQNLFLKSGIN